MVELVDLVARAVGVGVRDGGVVDHELQDLEAHVGQVGVAAQHLLAHVRQLVLSHQVPIVRGHLSGLELRQRVDRDVALVVTLDLGVTVVLRLRGLRHVTSPASG